MLRPPAHNGTCDMVAQCDHATCTAAGTCDKCIHETAKCNTQSCDPRNLPRCHDQHIHCRVVEKQMPPNAWVNSSFHQDGTPLMTNGCSDGARFAYSSCHKVRSLPPEILRMVR